MDDIDNLYTTCAHVHWLDVSVPMHIIFALVPSVNVSTLSNIGKFKADHQGCMCCVVANVCWEQQYFSISSPVYATMLGQFVWQQISE